MSSVFRPLPMPRKSSPRLGWTQVSSRVGRSALAGTRADRRRSGRPLCANSGCSATAQRTHQIDPKRLFKTTAMNRR